MDHVLLLDIGAAGAPVTTPVTVPEGDWMPKPYLAPAVPTPTGVVTQAVADGVAITWDAVSQPNVVYVVERAPDVAGVPGAWVEVARTTDTRYTYTQGTGGLAYYRIRAEIRGAPSVPSDPQPEEPVPVSVIVGDVVAIGAAVDAEIAARIAGDAAEASARAAALLAEASARAVDLTNEANARAAAIAAEATARTSAISAAVAAEATVRGAAITSEQTARQDADAAISANLVATAAAINNRLAFAPFRTYGFDANADGWVVVGTGATLAHNAAGYVRHTRGTATTWISRDLVSAERIDGAKNAVVRFRVRTSHGQAMAGLPFYFGTVAGGADETRRKNFSLVASAGWQLVELDMTGVADWGTSLVTQLRIGGILPADGQYVDVDWVSVGAFGPPTSGEQYAGTVTAVQALESRATSIEGVNTVQGTSITQLQTDMTTVNGQLALKASSAALAALDSRVTSAEGTLTSQGTAITSVQASIANRAFLGGNGSNILWDEYTHFRNATLPTMVFTEAAVSQAADAAAPGGYVLRVTTTGTTNTATLYLASTTNDHNLQMEPGRYLLSFDAWSDVAGHQIQPTLRNQAGGIYTDPDFPTVNGSGGTITLTAARARYVLAITLPAGTTAGEVRFRQNVSGVSGRLVNFDKIMLEKAVGTEKTASQWVPGPTSRVDAGKASAAAVTALDARVTATETTNTTQSSNITTLQNDLTTANTQIALKASSAALTALDSRVTAAEGSLTTQAGSITSLTNSLANIGGDNLLINSSFEDQATAARARHWTATNGGTGTVTGFASSFVASPLPSSTNALRLEASALGATRYLESSLTTTDAGVRPKAAPGQRHTLTVMARGTPGADFRTYIQYMDASNGVLQTAQLGGAAFTDTFARYTLTSLAAPAGTTQVGVYAGRLFGAAGDPARWLEVDNVQLQEGTVATAYQPSAKLAADADAAALSSLGTRVTAAEGTITSQGTSLTSLTNTINNPTTGLATRASSAALTALDSRVTSAEGTLSSQASSITAIRASLGGGSNLLTNATFEAGLDGWTAGANDTGLTPIVDNNNGVLAGDSNRYAPLATNSLRISIAGTPAAAKYVERYSEPMPAEAGKKYIASCWVNAFRCSAKIWLVFYDAAGGVLANPSATQVATALTNPTLAQMPRMAVPYPAPANAATMRMFVHLYTTGATNPYAWFTRPMVEEVPSDKTAPSEWAAGGVGVDSKYAAITQSLDTRAIALEAGQVVLQAQYVLSVDVNGRVGGMRLANNGTQVALEFLADQFKLVNPSGADSLTWENGVMVARSGAYMKVTGKGFGVGGALIEWYGPVMAVSACATNNSLYHMTKTGSAYFGGTLSAGTLHSAGRWNLNAGNWSDATYATCTHVGSNGAPKTVVISASIAHVARYSGNVAGSYPSRTGSITVGLFRGATELARWTVSASSGATFYPLEPGNPDSNYTENLHAWNFGSQTVTDSVTTTGNIDYTLKVITSSGSRYDPTSGLFTIAVTEQ